MDQGCFGNGYLHPVKSSAKAYLPLSRLRLLPNTAMQGSPQPTDTSRTAEKTSGISLSYVRCGIINPLRIDSDWNRGDRAAGQVGADPIGKPPVRQMQAMDHLKGVEKRRDRGAFLFCARPWSSRFRENCGPVGPEFRLLSVSRKFDFW